MAHKLLFFMCVFGANILCAGDFWPRDEKPNVPFQQPGNKKGKKVPSSQSNNGERKRLPARAKEIMECWIKKHLDNPYPDGDVKEELARRGNITVTQVNNWFTNARRRDYSDQIHDMKEKNENSFVSENIVAWPKIESRVEFPVAREVREKTARGRQANKLCEEVAAPRPKRQRIEVKNSPIPLPTAVVQESVQGLYEEFSEEVAEPGPKRRRVQGIDSPIPEPVAVVPENNEILFAYENDETENYFLNLTDPKDRQNLLFEDIATFIYGL